MSVYEDYDGLERPNERPVSPSPKRGQNRTAWLILILLYLSGCSYWGWQVFLRPDGEIIEDQTSIVAAETETLLADDYAAQTESETRLLASTGTLPDAPPNVPVAPNSKPATVRTQRPKRKGRPLDKMEAETGLVYDTDRASPASAPDLEHADQDVIGTQMDGADVNDSVDIDYANDPTIDQRDIPPASQSARGVVFDKLEEARAPDTVPEPNAEPAPIAETDPDLPAIEQATETVVLSESLPPVEEIISAPPPPEPAPPQVNVIIDPHPPTNPPVQGHRPVQPVIYVEPTPPVVIPPPYQPVFDYDGAFVVQIASFANVEAACSVWEDLRFEHPRLFGDAETIVRPHRTNSGRVLHRLRVGAFAKRRHATDWCLAYKDTGGECFVTRR